MIVSQFYINGNAKQAELVRMFGIQPLALKRWVKRYRTDGPKAFFETCRKRHPTPKKSLWTKLTRQTQSPPNPPPREASPPPTKTGEC